MREKRMGRTEWTWLAMTVAAAISAGCAAYQPVAQPSGSLLLAQLPDTKYRILGPAEGQACAHYVLPIRLLGVTGIFVGGVSNTYQEAVKQALASRPGAEHLLQATADLSAHGVPLLYERVCVLTRGLAIALTPAAGS
jgi:hypothetical protein